MTNIGGYYFLHYLSLSFVLQNEKALFMATYNSNLVFYSRDNVEERSSCIIGRIEKIYFNKNVDVYQSYFF